MWVTHWLTTLAIGAVGANCKVLFVKWQNGVWKVCTHLKPSAFCSLFAVLKGTLLSQLKFTPFWCFIWITRSDLDVFCCSDDCALQCTGQRLIWENGCKARKFSGSPQFIDCFLLSFLLATFEGSQFVVFCPSPKSYAWKEIKEEVWLDAEFLFAACWKYRCKKQKQNVMCFYFYFGAFCCEVAMRGQPTNALLLRLLLLLNFPLSWANLNYKLDTF